MSATTTVRNKVEVIGTFMAIRASLPPDRVDIDIQIGEGGRTIVVCCVGPLANEIRKYYEVGDGVVVVGRLPDFVDAPQFQVMATELSKGG